jgi:hypothetical protein
MPLPVPGPLTRRVGSNMSFERPPIKEETLVLIRIAALALALTGPAAAQDYNQPDIVRGLCQKDGCDEFRVLSAEPVTSTEEGRLLRTRIQTFHASSRGRANQSEENGYVYCSRTKPAIMAEQNGQTMAFFLAPFATQESRESVRQNANFHALYFAICHGQEAGQAAVHNLAGVAQRHGYRVALAQSKLVPLTRAEDVLTMANGASERLPSEARLDERWQRAPAEARREERAQRPPREAMAQDRQMRQERRPTSSHGLEPEDDGFLSGARRLTNRAFDALDGMFRKDRD